MMDIEQDANTTDQPVRRKVSLAPPPAAAPVVEVQEEEAATPDAPEVKKKELLDRIALRTDMKRGDMRRVVEATLAVIGESLMEGEQLNIQPLGKIQILNEKDQGKAKIFRCKIRHIPSSGASEDEEES